jgi:hypothetical protein
MRIMKKLLFLLVLSLCPVLRANADYILTEKGDTIYGKILKSYGIRETKIKIRTAEGERTILFQDISEYRKGGKEFMKVRFVNQKGKTLVYHCRVMNQGEIRLLIETGNEVDEYFALHNGQFYRLNRRHFSDEVWRIMSQCSAFRIKYQAYYDANKDKRFLFFPRQERVWINMLNDYNFMMVGQLEP